jgi:hypothetical protein
MPVTINVRPRNHLPISYNLTPEQENQITPGELKAPVNSFKEFDSQEIKDIEMENSGSSSISDLTEMKHRKLKNGTEKFKPKD